MSVEYCANFSQNVMQSGFKIKSSLKQGLADEAKATTGEETRQLAPESSSDHVRNCFSAKALTATFLLVSGGSS
jgi:hypothetical protein